MADFWTVRRLLWALWTLAALLTIGYWALLFPLTGQPHLQLVVLAVYLVTGFRLVDTFKFLLAKAEARQERGHSLTPSGGELQGGQSPTVPEKEKEPT